MNEVNRPVAGGGGGVRPDKARIDTLTHKNIINLIDFKGWKSEEMSLL